MVSLPVVMWPRGQHCRQRGNGSIVNVESPSEVLPSVIDTPANRVALPKADFTRWVKPESIAKLLVYLVSDAAADTSGAVIPIYGRA